MSFFESTAKRSVASAIERPQMQKQRQITGEGCGKISRTDPLRQEKQTADVLHVGETAWRVQGWISCA